VVRGRQKGRREPESAGAKVLTNFRLPERLLDDLEQVRSALGRATLVEIVREALEQYAAQHQELVRAIKRERQKRLKE
jgi:hypothetical protein